jgi:hypothetical protein
MSKSSTQFCCQQFIRAAPTASRADLLGINGGAKLSHLAGG